MAAAPISKVFISYSHKDTLYRDRLQEHLTPFVRSGRIPLWVDTQIRPGDDWHDEIRQGLADAQVAILLVSVSFLASSFIADEELPALLTAAVERSLVILPVVVTPCNFALTNLSRFQAVNEPSKPLSGLSQHEQDLIWEKVVKAVLERLKAPPAPKEVAPPPPVVSAASSALLTEQGEQHRAVGRYAEALGCYEQALALDGRYLRALRGRAWALKERHLPDALAAAEETLELHPKDAETHYLRGLVLREMGREEDALAALDEALKLYPRYEQAHSARVEVIEALKPKIPQIIAEGQHHFRAKRYTESLEAYDRALALDERNADAWLSKSVALMQLKRPAEALAANERALALDERNAAAWYCKAELLWRLDRNEEALAAYERALALNERFITAWAGKYLALQRLGREAEAQQALQRYGELIGQANEPPAQSGPPPPQKQPTPAAAAPEKTIEQWMAERQAHYDAKRYKEALEANERVVALDERNPNAWLWKGFALRGLNRNAEALVAYERALTLDERYADAWAWKGIALRALGRTEEAEQALQRARQLTGQA
jgi:tetratricopeptide (TPR) repeat protein